MRPSKKIPLFPLGVVLFPGTVLPLHIFEDRYKIMIGECLAENREFGVVYSESNEIKKIGCTARIERVLERYEDGRMDIVTRGGRRFMIHMISDDRPYLQAQVAYFHDGVEEESEEIVGLISRGIALLEQLDSLMGKRKDYDEILKLDHRTISFWISNSTGFTADEKQRFLEMTSTSGRIRKSVGSLERVVKRMRTNQEIKRLIGGNGNFRKMV